MKQKQQRAAAAATTIIPTTTTTTALTDEPQRVTRDTSNKIENGKLK